MYWVNPPSFPMAKLRGFLNQSLNHTVYLFFFFVLTQQLYSQSEKIVLYSCCWCHFIWFA